MDYSELNLKTNQKVNTVKIGEKEISVLQYLPIQDKIDLVQVSLQEADEGVAYNEMKLDINFNLNLVYMYTDLLFTEEQKANPQDLYDELESNGVFQKIINTMEEDEYQNLLRYLNNMQRKYTKNKNSLIGLLQTVLKELPENVNEAADIINNFDKDKYKELIQFAQSANGDRPI